MSNTTWIYVKRERLPAPRSLQSSIRSARIPMRIDPDWGWADSEGFLPVVWNGSETGFEISVEKLPRKSANRLRKTGRTDLDSIIAVTTRSDWDGAKAACAFIGVLAKCSDGLIDDDEDVLIESAKAMKWARNGIAELDAAGAANEVREKLVSLANEGGDPGGRLDLVLDRFRARAVTRIDTIMTSVCVRTGDGIAVSGPSWRLTLPDGTLYDATRYYAAATPIVNFKIAGEDFSDEELARYDELTRMRDAAGEREDVIRESALREIRTWPDPVVIRHARRSDGPGIALSFSAPEGAELEFIGSNMLCSISVHDSPLTYAVDASGISVR